MRISRGAATVGLIFCGAVTGCGDQATDGGFDEDDKDTAVTALGALPAPESGWEPSSRPLGGPMGEPLDLIRDDRVWSNAEGTMYGVAWSVETDPEGAEAVCRDAAAWLEATGEELPGEAVDESTSTTPPDRLARLCGDAVADGTPGTFASTGVGSSRNTVVEGIQYGAWVDVETQGRDARVSVAAMARPR